MANKKTIEFKITKQKNEENPYSIEIYKHNLTENNKSNIVHVDTIKLLSMMELWKLKIFLEEYIQKNDWE